MERGLDGDRLKCSYIFLEEAFMEEAFFQAGQSDSQCWNVSTYCSLPITCSRYLLLETLESYNWRLKSNGVKSKE